MFGQYVFFLWTYTWSVPNFPSTLFGIETEAFTKMLFMSNNYVLKYVVGGDVS